MSRLDDAIDRGYEPGWDDLLPAAEHLHLPPEDPWMQALAAATAEARRLHDAT